MKLTLKTFFTLLLLSSCVQMPSYKPLKPDSPREWKTLNAASPREQPQKNEWWKAYKDPILNTLVEKGIEQNYDLKQAEEIIQKAKFNADIGIAALLPDVNISGNISRGKRGSSSQNRLLRYSEIYPNIQWNLDLFGVYRKQYEAALAAIEKESFTYESVKNNLIADIVITYFEVQLYAQQIKITKETATSQENTYQLSHSRYEAGLVSELDVSQARSLYLTTKAQVHEFETLLQTSKNRLTTLLGLVPGALEVYLSDQLEIGSPEGNIACLLSSPSETLKNRPDIKAAERIVAMTALQKEAMIATQYPQINVGFLFGYQDSNTFKPQGIWQSNAGLIFPLLNFGRIKAQIYALDSTEKAQVFAYQQTVLLALEEIESALASYFNEAKTLKDLEKAVTSLKETVSLANERYQKGLTSFNDVLIAEKSLFEAETRVAESKRDICKKYAAIAKALALS